jgi:hypothetical protein
VEQGRNQGMVERVNLLQLLALLSHTPVVVVVAQVCHLESSAKVD